MRSRDCPAASRESWLRSRVRSWRSIRRAYRSVYGAPGRTEDPPREEHRTEGRRGKVRGRGEVSGEGMPAEGVGGECEAAARERALAAAVAAASGGGMGIAGGRGVGVRKEVRETVGPGAGTRIVAAEAEAVAVAVAVPLLVAVVVGRRRRSRGPADPWCDVVKGFQKQ